VLDRGTLRELLSKADKVSSEHQVIVEWNMNRYRKISQYGLYLGRTGGTVQPPSAYDSNDLQIVDGSNHIIYDDDYVEESDEDKFFSNLGSVFEPDRPDAGIVLLQKNKDAMISVNPLREMSTLSMTAGSARFYPFMKNRPYDYFNSAKNMTASPVVTGGRSDKTNGFISDANPFVVYESFIPANKIVIKTQKHVSYPRTFYVDVLKESSSTTWTQIYSATDSTEMSDGKLEIYYNGSTWSTTMSRVTDITKIYSGTTQVDRIVGLRLRVAKMLVPTRSSGKKYESSLELIEMSPRVEADVTDYTESFSYDLELSESQFGIPVGGIVKGGGNITLSNETNAFIAASALPSLKMLSPNVEFRFYQKVTASAAGDDLSTSVYTVPLRTLYADSWSNSEDYTTTVALSDRFKLFQEKNVPDLAFFTKNGIPFSVIVLTLLDNCGITGYEFKKTSNANIADNDEDIRIQNFFCDKDQTLMEVLEDLAISTQSSMYIDSSNNLSIMTKERVAQTKDTSLSSSVLATTGTDFWFVGDENFSDTGVPEYVSSSYVSNISSIQESKILPVTDGDITYHQYGFRKEPGRSLLDGIPDQYLQDQPAISVAIGSGFLYKTTNLWSVGSDNSAVLGAANLIETINDQRLKDNFTGTIAAFSQEDAIRKMYANATTLAKRRSLLIALDRNEIYTIPDYEGYVMVDGEFIEFYGKVFEARTSTSSATKIFFNDEDMTTYISSVGTQLRSSLIPIGLIVKPEFSVTQNSSGSYVYEVIGDGRGAFNSKVIQHNDVNSNIDVDTASVNRFSVKIGEVRSKNLTSRPKLSSTIRYNFDDIRGFKGIQQRLNLPAKNRLAYLGHLKISGPKALPVDSSTISTASINAQQQNINNKKADDDVPGSGSLSFDDFVFFIGERDVHGQIIPIRFPPNIVTARMRLFSGRKDVNGKNAIASTLSSIAGLAFDVKKDGTGYYLEVESIGSGKDSVSPRAVNRNLRFYKMYYNAKGRLAVEMLFAGAVNVQTVVNRDIDIVTDPEVPTDPVFELSIAINRVGNSARYDIYYGDKKVNTKPIIDVKYNSAGKKVFDRNATIEKNIVVFVRNDSQAIVEYVAAGGIPSSLRGREPLNYNNVFDQMETQVSRGLAGMIAQGAATKMFYNPTKNGIYYFNDFAKIVRQVKKYEVRYNNGPARLARLIETSRVNPRYAIRSQEYTPFGAEIVVMNTAPGAIAMSEDTDLPLYIYGIMLEELSTGAVSLVDLFEKDINYKNKSVDLSFNKAVNGEKTFSLDSAFIQNREQAKRMMGWIARNSSRERLSLDMEIFANPILEIGDKVKVVAKDRGYYQNNAAFGDKTFVVSSISYNVSQEGPSMNVKLIEVGEI
jgi:hypothetical protein